MVSISVRMRSVEIVVLLKCAHSSREAVAVIVGVAQSLIDLILSWCSLLLLLSTAQLFDGRDRDRNVVRRIPAVTQIMYGGHVILCHSRGLVFHFLAELESAGLPAADFLLLLSEFFELRAISSSSLDYSELSTSGGMPSGL